MTSRLIKFAAVPAAEIRAALRGACLSTLTALVLTTPAWADHDRWHDPKRAEKLLNSGQEHERKGQLDLAADDYARAEAIDSDNPNYKNHLVRILRDNHPDIQCKICLDTNIIHESNYYPTVKLFIESCTVAIQHETSSTRLSQAYLTRGDNYYRNGKVALAMRDFDKALELDPNNVSVYYLRYQMHSMKDQDAAALADLKKIIELDPSPGQHIFDDLERLRKDLRGGGRRLRLN